MIPLRFVAALLILALLAGCNRQHIGRRLSPAEAVMLKHHETNVSRVLDTLHESAAAADAGAYFGCFASGAVFLGTDETERWTLEQFKQYAMPLFAKGKGWTYLVRNRHVWVSIDGWAVFDELLENRKYGTCRGSGSMRLYDTVGWKIEQYDLSVPIPNEMLEDVARQIRMRPTTPAPVPATAHEPPRAADSPAPSTPPQPVEQPPASAPVPPPPATPPPAPTGQ